MLFLPFLATILMVATFGHVSGEETLAIPLLADFETNILSPVKAFCLQTGRRKVLLTDNTMRIITLLSEKERLIYPIFCESVKALDNTFKEFEGNFLKRMDRSETFYGNLIFSAIQTHGLLKYPGVMPGIIPDYRDFVTKVGAQIVGTMTHSLHQCNTKFLNEKEKDEVNDEMDKKIGIINEIGKTKKLELLKGLFLKKVKEISETRGNKTDPHMQWKCMYGLQRVLTEIGENSKGEDAEKQLKFSLALFVANLKYVEVLQNPSNTEYSNKWKDQMTLKALSEN